MSLELMRRRILNWDGDWSSQSRRKLRRSQIRTVFLRSSTRSKRWLNTKPTTRFYLEGVQFPLEKPPLHQGIRKIRLSKIWRAPESSRKTKKREKFFEIPKVLERPGPVIDRKSTR